MSRADISADIQYIFAADLIENFCFWTQDVRKCQLMINLCEFLAKLKIVYILCQDIPR